MTPLLTDPLAVLDGNEEGRSATEVTETPVHLPQGDSPTSDTKGKSNDVGASVASELRDKVRELAEARALLARHAETVKALRAEFDKTFATLLLAQKAAAEQVNALDTSVRALALVEYGATQSKAVAPGVNIRMRDTLLYDPAVAFAWAKQKDMATVPESLDVGAFEKIAKATKLPFVIYAETPEVTIASKLVEVLAGVLVTEVAT